MKKTNLETDFVEGVICDALEEIQKLLVHLLERHIGEDDARLGSNHTVLLVVLSLPVVDDVPQDTRDEEQSRRLKPETMVELRLLAIAGAQLAIQVKDMD